LQRYTDDNLNLFNINHFNSSEGLMSGHYSTDTAKIRTLTNSMVSLLENAREETISIGQIEQGARLLTEAYQDILNTGSKQLISESESGFGATLSSIEDAYSNWRSVEGAFARTLDLAYNGYISRDHLQTDTTLAQLRLQIGRRILALHSKLHTAWRNHLATRPWDDFLVAEEQDKDPMELNANVSLLVKGDHLDVEDAIEGLTGPLRYAFADYVERRSAPLDLLEEGLWMRPEILLMNDYWGFNTDVRLMDTLSKKQGAKRAGSFAHVQSLFAYSGVRAPDHIVRQLEKVRLDEKDTYYRCLMLHPDHEIRRYATNNVDTDGFWKVATPQTVPCATILSMLERVVKSRYYDENFQKVFFRTIHRRLFNLISRSEVLYARGIIRILTRLPFFLEDKYFEKLTVLIDYVSGKEKFFRIERSVLDEFNDQLRREKDRIGTLQGRSPQLTSIPAVVLRKLARDGHYWFDLAMHPMYKIARETIPHINTADRALRVAKNHVVNQDVLRVVGKRRSLFPSAPAKVALLTNPRTPPAVSIPYITDLSMSEITTLLRKGGLHPELLESFAPISVGLKPFARAFENPLAE
jgi:hypothetical protein